MMKRSFMKTCGVIAITFALSACAGSRANTRDYAAIGAIVGGIAGAVVGHQVGGKLVGSAIGAGLGLLTGAAIGDAKDAAIQDNNASQKAPLEETGGRWITVPGSWVAGRWVPSHREWVPDDPGRVSKW